jgi:hypothetical protein
MATASNHLQAPTLADFRRLDLDADPTHRVRRLPP